MRLCRDVAVSGNILHKERENGTVAVVSTPLVHEFVRQVIVVDDDNLPAEDLKVEDISCAGKSRSAAIIIYRQRGLTIFLRPLKEGLSLVCTREDSVVPNKRVGRGTRRKVRILASVPYMTDGDEEYEGDAGSEDGPGGGNKGDGRHGGLVVRPTHGRAGYRTLLAHLYPLLFPRPSARTRGGL